MQNSTNITDAACAFLEELSDNMRAQTDRIAASGDPDASRDHYALMTLHNKLSAIPREGDDWQSFADNVLATTEAFQRHLHTGGFYGAPIIGSIKRDIICLLDQHTPAVNTFRGLLQYLRQRPISPAHKAAE